MVNFDANINTGETGTNGNPGDAGATGNNGDSGVTGNNGGSGVTGNNGGSGVTGNNEGSGVTGNNGGSGVTGNNGGSGVTGNNGGSGVTGNNGGSGDTGNNGGFGVTGNNGGSGVTGNNGGSGVTGNNGGSGVTGNNGGSGDTGSNGGSGGIGVSGDTGSSGSTDNTGNSRGTGNTENNGSTGGKDTRNAIIDLQIGEKYHVPNNTCAYYECREVNGVAILTKVEKVCQPLDISICDMSTLTYDADNCCRTCTPKTQLIVTPPPEIIEDCSVRKNVTVLEQDDCILEVELSYCGGPCMGSSMYSMASNSLDQKCSCCKEMEFVTKNVQLLCAKGRRQNYSYVDVLSCGCAGAVCVPQN
ncbi:hypothetical protein XELAEV_18024299mg [Xenopus laevis]|nr:hypothetical protein XELAEV_18024299mg [Xenopus laevis]